MKAYVIAVGVLDAAQDVLGELRHEHALLFRRNVLDSLN